MASTSPSLLALCRWIRYGAVLFVVAVIGIYLVTWIRPEITVMHRHPVLHIAGLPSGVLATMSASDRLMVAAVSVPYLAVLVWAIYRLVHMLRQFERGLFFERETVSDLRAFSGLLLLSKLLALAAMHLRVWLVVHVMGHQSRVTMINLSSDDLAIILLCALFFAIAAMMEEGRKLAEENREFV